MMDKTQSLKKFVYVFGLHIYSQVIMFAILLRGPVTGHKNTIIANICSIHVSPYAS